MKDFTIPRLGFGAANLGNLLRALTDDEAWAILDAAWDEGVRYFDTAPHYGLGLSERRLGAFLATKPREEFVVSTKVGRLVRPNPEWQGELDLENDFLVPAETRRVWDFSADGIRLSIEESLERTGLDRFDVLYLHDPERGDLDAGVNQAIPALAGLRDEGITRAIGVGSMDTAALLASARTGALDLLMVAGRYTLAEQPALAEVVPTCRAHGVGIVNASVFNSGLLATDNPSAGDRYEYGGVPDALLARVREIAEVCHSFDVSLPTAALQYTLRDDTVRSLVMGASSPDQVRQNAARMTETIPNELWAALVDRELIPE
ncbi:aldo/keto reductase [Mycetocola zhadangensis]|uniref:Aldo/keto reductase n=1 Tax=Mycetocola zhadangensis TaxID=1164595 RepID=A0A3L7IWU6_9MICO|nr:aldo/keto reductase [Mycetocola zhadangensis]RLQ82708.1 aldo/keto reductase [Mycetocola zhadangensis]GGE98870.1 oxidoreductase [Mycetocola zhadangensis]